MLLVEAIKDGSLDGMKFLPPLIVHKDNGDYTDEIHEIYFGKDHKAYMYVLECADGSLYTGYTTDLDKRIATHNAGKGAKYTKTRLPVKLIYSETFNHKNAAMSAEARFKQKTRQQKLDYIREHSKPE